MTADLKRRIAVLEAKTSTTKPVREMTDAELLAILGLREDATDAELLASMGLPADASDKEVLRPLTGAEAEGWSSG